MSWSVAEQSSTFQSHRNEAILVRGWAVIWAISQRNLCWMLCHNAKQPHTLPIYKLNVLMTLLFTPCPSLEP